jgi:predicted dehydrogenase
MNERLASLQGAARLPRLGFLGTGWIGRHRMDAILKTGLVQPVAVADPSDEMMDAALTLAPEAKRCASVEDLLDQDLDGLVIATPSALHAEQSIRALDRGLAVFCQKPLGRDAQEVAAVVAAARRADRLLGVDLSYRQTRGMRAIRDLIRSGSLGEIFACDLVFHNAYGPDKPWFYDKRQSGGGALIDLGVHLVDLALWTLDFPDVVSANGRLYAKGRPITGASPEVEDYAEARIELSTGATIRIACSWGLHAGQDAEIRAAFHGVSGGAEMRNVGGSFYDFVTEEFHGTTRHERHAPPEEWGGLAAAAWARDLAAGKRFDPEAEKLIAVAEVLDRIYLPDFGG